MRFVPWCHPASKSRIELAAKFFFSFPAEICARLPTFVLDFIKSKKVKPLRENRGLEKSEDNYRI
jgi:hypothetical protein